MFSSMIWNGIIEDQSWISLEPFEPYSGSPDNPPPPIIPQPKHRKSTQLDEYISNCFTKCTIELVLIARIDIRNDTSKNPETLGWRTPLGYSSRACGRRI